MVGNRDFVSLALSVFHFSVFTVYIVALNNDQTLDKRRDMYGGRWKYLTFINELLQAFYFGVACLNDVFGSNLRPGQDHKRSSLQKFRDIVLTSLAFPMGLFVVVTFWGIYAINRELVFPKELDEIFPSWLNHIMHTTVIVFLLVEKFLIYHPYPSRRKGLAICLAFALTYQIWIFWIAFYAEIWVYPILEVLPWPGRMGFLAVCWTLFFAFYMLGEFTTNKLWAVPAKARAKKCE